MYSLWFTTPVSFAVGDYALAPPVQYSSFFHEMGHNFSLNSPAAFAYGDRTGDASNIYTEALAQILQHVTAYMLINNRNSLGLDDFTAKEIALNALSSMRTLRKSHEDWLAAGMKFSSWNDPATPEDDTVGPFMTVAYTFLKHAFNRQTGYRLPLRRMMRLLQCFNPDWYARYAQSGNSPDAEQFRATLMVAAVSYGLSSDLRDEFKAMHFPIGDDIYTEMLRAAETR
jgi:hypothetical protein